MRRRLLVLGVLSLLWTGLPGTLRASGEEMVPAGALRVDARLAVTPQRRAIATDGQAGDFRDYAFTSARERRQVSGELSRVLTWLDLGLLYGMSDTWNLSVTVPVGRLEQTADLSTDTTDPQLAARVDSLESETLSGLGDVALASHHRVVYSDWTSLVLGVRATVPGSPQDNPYIGRPTLALARPGPTLGAFMRLTAFPVDTRGRLDLQASVNVGLPARVDTPTEDDVTLHQANFNAFSLTWRGIGRAMDWGLGLRAEVETQNTLDGENLNDDRIAWIVRGEWGGGNLGRLEEGPVPLPWAWRLAVDQPVSGFNTPLGTEVSLLGRLYF